MKKAKEYRKLVRQYLPSFPACVREVLMRKNVLGSEIINQGTTEIQGKAVDPDLTYTQSHIAVEWIDHYKECVKYCKKFGATRGIQVYSLNLRVHLEHMKKKYPAYFESQRPAQIPIPELQGQSAALPEL